MSTLTQTSKIVRFISRQSVERSMRQRPSSKMAFSTTTLDSNNNGKESQSDNNNNNNNKEWNDNGDQYWISQIHKQGEERPDYQWFRDRSSLPFDCTGCGKCCTTKGNVYLSPDEHETAATFLKLSKDEFIQQYASHVIFVDQEHTKHAWKGNNTAKVWVRLVDQSTRTTTSITKSTDNSHKCIFLNEDNTCQIYPVRPIQCSTYPFWTNILASRKAWNKEVRQATNRDDYDLPSLDGGRCEGMLKIGDGQDNEQQRKSPIGGVSRQHVYEQAYRYEQNERRFPRGKEIPVDRNTPS